MLNGCKKIEYDGVEQRRFFQIYKMAGARHDTQGSIRKHALEKKVGLETRRVLIANDEQDRTIKSAQWICEMP